MSRKLQLDAPFELLRPPGSIPGIGLSGRKNCLAVGDRYRVDSTSDPLAGDDRANSADQFRNQFVAFETQLLPNDAGFVKNEFSQ